MRKKLLLGLTSLIIMGNSCTRNTYIEGEEVVDCVYIHKYGLPVPAEDWMTRGENGKIVSMLKNGVVVTKNYSNGALNGEVTYTFPFSDTIEKMETYVDGRLKSRLHYYRSGIPMKEVQYTSPTLQKLICWYESGSPQYKEQYENSLVMEAEYYNPNHQIESNINDGRGTRINRDQYGTLLSTETIEQGLLVLKTIPHGDGTPKEIIPYANGKVHGVRKTFFPGGEPNTVEEYIEGNRHGLATYYQNGEKISEVTYVDGKKTGIERHFREGKNVVEEITWKEDMKHGPSTTYVGNVKNTEWYQHGRLVNKRSEALAVKD